MNLDAAAIAAATGGRLLRDGPAGPVLTDTRALVPGSWFLALRGERFDGHAYLARAQELGAVGCVVSELPGPEWAGGAVIVEDTTRALQDLGRAARARFTGPVIGLTGSSGKTTTRALIALAVSGLGRIHQTVGNLNNQLGVPMTLLATPDDASGIVVEMGTSSPGEIGLLAAIASPTVRLIVNVGPAHLEELGGLEGVAREKGALFDTARPNDLLCVNVDDPFVRAMKHPPGTHAVPYGRDASAMIRLTGATIDPVHLATRATYETPNGSFEVRIPAPGAHIAHNGAGALAVAYAVGLDLGAAAAALEGYEPVGMRMRAEELPSGVVALNDAYNANPASMEASLRVLAAVSGRRVAVIGDMLELGADEASWHRRTAALAATLGLDLLVLVGPRMAAARDAALLEGATEVWSAEDPMAIVDRLRDWLEPGDRVLFKGSRGARVERILQALRGDAAEAH